MAQKFKTHLLHFEMLAESCDLDIALIAFYGPEIDQSGYIDWSGYCVNYVLWHQSRLVWELPIAIYTTRAVAAAVVVVVDLSIDHGSDMTG